MADGDASMNDSYDLVAEIAENNPDMEAAL